MGTRERDEDEDEGEEEGEEEEEEDEDDGWVVVPGRDDGELSPPLTCLRTLD